MLDVSLREVNDMELLCCVRAETRLLQNRLRTERYSFSSSTRRSRKARAASG